MPKPLKDYYDLNFLDELAEIIFSVHPAFPKQDFISLVTNDSWNDKELKERMKHISFCLHKTLPADFNEAINILQKAAPFTPKRKTSGFLYIFMPDFVEQYGINDWKNSMEALELFTQHSTSELAVRPFIIKDQDKMMKIMTKWSQHPNYHVRRLSSEGCRPRLPWAISLPEFKRNPSPILPILENLKNDPSEYVRRSVANNLNDISKDHQDLALEIAEKWLGQNKETDRLVKHALRTLLKSSNKKALSLFGFKDNKDINVKEINLKTNEIKIGDELEFSFSISLNKNKTSKIRIEYAIYYLKANNKLSKKVFKISERDKINEDIIKIEKKHSFKNLTTRKHYSGQHAISVIVNGEQYGRKSFMLKN